MLSCAVHAPPDPFTQAQRVDDFRKAQMSRASDILKKQAAEKADRDRHLAALYKVGASCVAAQEALRAPATPVSCAGVLAGALGPSHAVMLIFHVFCLPSRRTTLLQSTSPSLGRATDKEAGGAWRRRGASRCWGKGRDK